MSTWKLTAQHRGGLRVQELPPGRVGVPFWCRWDLKGLEDAADRGGADPVAELEELALDALVSPAMVLSGEPLDELGDLGASRRASRPVRIGPLLSHQLTVPPHDGAGRDQPVHPQTSGQEPDQRGQSSATGPVQPWPGTGTAQYGDLVPQDKQLDVLGRR